MRRDVGLRRILPERAREEPRDPHRTDKDTDALTRARPITCLRPTRSPAATDRSASRPPRRRRGTHRTSPSGSGSRDPSRSRCSPPIARGRTRTRSVRTPDAISTGTDGARPRLDHAGVRGQAFARSRPRVVDPDLPVAVRRDRGPCDIPSDSRRRSPSASHRSRRAPPRGRPPTSGSRIRSTRRRRCRRARSSCTAVRAPRPRRTR